MAAYNPRTRVFSYGGTTPKARRERHALDEFCKRMRRRYRATFAVIPVRAALRRGLVVKVDDATVDGARRTSRGPVAVELLGYSPLRDRGDVMTRDLAFRKAVIRALYARLHAKRYSLLLGYRELRRTAPASGTRRTVPHQEGFRAIIRELRSVVHLAPPLDSNARFLSVRFVRSDVARTLGTRGGNLYLDATRFPVCAAHFDRVRLQGLRSALPPQVDSNLSGGFIGLAEGWVTEHLRRKAERSLNKSRLRANGLPLWLIVHSDGHAKHQTIPEQHRSRAVEVCREVLAAVPHGFARAYWADRTAFLDAAWIGRIL